MTDSPDRLTSLLDAVPDSPAPVEALRAAGERAQRRRRSVVTAGVAAAAVVVVAVGSLLVAPDDASVPPGSVADRPVSLDGSWVVESLLDETGGETIASRQTGRATLEFDGVERVVRGTDGCSDFGGSYELADERLRVPTDALTSTEPLCPTTTPPLAVRLIDVRRVAADGEDVLLLDADGALVARLSRESAADVDLVGSWVVVDLAVAMTDIVRPPVTVAFDVAPRPDETVAGEAATGTMTGETECNTIGAPYRRDGTSLAFAPPASTAVACRNETPLAEVLGGVAALGVDGDDVLLLDEAGDRLARLVREDR